MPVVDNLLSSPYPTVGAVMNMARVRVNDAMAGLQGELLMDDDPATAVMLQTAWSWLQAQAATAGVMTFVRVAVLSALPASTTRDAANQARLGWTGYSDGVNEYEQPALPQDLILPLEVRRRMSMPAGVVNTNALYPMAQATDGLPGWIDHSVYDWREDGLYFFAPGQPQDLQIRYAAYRAALDPTNPAQPVEMMMCEDCLSARVAYEYASLRDATAAPRMAQMAAEAFNTIVKRSSKQKGHRTIFRRPAAAMPRWGQGYW